MIMIKCSLFLVLFLSLCHSFLADEVQVHISSKNTEDVDKFVHRILTSEFVKERNNKKDSVKTDIEIDLDGEIKKDDEKVKGEFQPLSIIKDSSLSCNMCLASVAGLEEVLDRSISPIIIWKTFVEHCFLLKFKFQPQCKLFYLTEGFRAIEQILKNDSALQICQNMQFCHKDQINNVAAKNFLIGKMKDTNCDNCQSLVQYYEDILNHKLPLTFVFRILSNVCNVYQTKYQQPCRDYFKDPVVVQVWTEILNNEAPLKVCQDAKACTKSAIAEDFQNFFPKVSYL